MAEKDATARLRRAVKENNLFIVKRLIQRTDMRNPDPGPRRYTSLAWSAVLANEETFEFLMNAGHDDAELSKDSENNTILMILADYTPSNTNSADVKGAALRMARMYYDRYPDILDWSNIHGKTALHLASLKGHEELVRMLCDFGADVDLSDNKGNTPLHYASSWGHIPIVQLLIERGCVYTAKNNDGFTALDYAYSFTTKDTLQDTARLQFENNKKSRRNVLAQAAVRGSDWAGPSNVPPPVPSKGRDIKQSPNRIRSGSGTSRTTTTSDSGEVESNGLAPAHKSQSSSSSPSTAPQPYLSPHGSTNGFVPSPSKMRSNSPWAPASSASPVATRMRERDADARVKFMNDSGMARNRSGSASTDNKSQNGTQYTSTSLSVDEDPLARMGGVSGSVTPRRLRPSVSAAQLRTNPDVLNIVTAFPSSSEHRTRSGTNPTAPRPTLPQLHRSTSVSTSPYTEHPPGSYTGPPIQYATFPEPPVAPDDSSTPTAGRRLPFNILSKPLPNADPPNINHRRGLSAASVRGP
ncbi:ANK-REP-REGION domain-containing protein [Mycena indigotica]|uniref:ANK-REP-REGION domain-containing protein n=1 Tax=Mycena indigotica TaxID=2126181 RepID=A0A8H6SMX3_9AGAR|nr:ANK-REP-REGION domain-containing protein [Mycena indigotica]KAF7301800.1 ANK-REP-REGION domain-containing protein [Mycena indigotica]